MVTKHTTIDEYMNDVNPEFRQELERIRQLVTELVPEVEETMSYRMATQKYKGRTLVYFTASKKHMSFYPSSWAIEEHRDLLDGYKTTAHAIQFTLKNPLPEDLIQDLVLTHKQFIDEDRKRWGGERKKPDHTVRLSNW